MRIRNSRSNFSQLTPSETTPRAAHLRSPQGSQYDRFLVEEANRRIGWSDCTRKDFPAQLSMENPLHDEMEAASSADIRPLSCVDKEKDVKHCMQITANLASEGRSEGEADKRKKSSSCAGSPGDRKRATSAAGSTLPYSLSQLEKLPYKKRKLYNHMGMQVEVEDLMLEVKVEDEITEWAKEKCVPVEVEGEDHLTAREEDAPVQVEVEDATAEMKEEDILVKVEVEGAAVEIEVEDAVVKLEEDDRAEVNEECATEEVEEEVATMMVNVEDATVEEEDTKVEVKEDTMMVEVKIEITKMNELEHFIEDDSCQRSQNCTRTCGSYVPYLTIDENQQGNQKKELGLEKTEFESNEKPRGGRKRNRSSQSASSDTPLKGRQKLSRGMSTRMQEQSIGNQGDAEIQKRKRGRPKKVRDDMPKPKRGRPKRVKDEIPKRKRGRPKKVKDQPGSQLM